MWNGSLDCQRVRIFICSSDAQSNTHIRSEAGVLLRREEWIAEDGMAGVGGAVEHRVLESERERESKEWLAGLSGRLDGCKICTNLQKHNSELGQKL